MADTELMKRLDKLERDNQRLQRGGLALLVLLVALTTVYATRTVPQKITAHEFDVVNGAGKVRIRMWVQKDGTASVGVFDTRGVIASDISWTNLMGPSIDVGFRKAPSVPSGPPHGSMLPDVTIEDTPLAGPAIMLTAGDKHAGLPGPSVDLGVTPSGQPNITLSDTKGKNLVSLSTLYGTGDLTLLNTNNSTSIGLGWNEQGPVINLTDAQGKPRMAFRVNASDEPNITLSDPQGFSMSLGSTLTATQATGERQQTSADSITMFGNDKEHHVIWQAP